MKTLTKKVNYDVMIVVAISVLMFGVALVNSF
ncbi:bifunctional riboflavin kinase/FMN adenylyltransferase [Caminibacter mediatlanticus TB-2]|uniref:Bifunctional riboflavin kinase/FMN adenylyltransferase n=1 Tax=Caminibacter mediatlanticus TB-2 TaxID=391592 RepID=A0AAI9AHV5_9BACT|nr:bifunctional riboflavin kinase/FMN adenylyltransferase [Caminibacter mediatlanticus TB-2]